MSLGVPLNHFEVDLEQRLVPELMILVIGHAVGQEGDGDLRDGPESGGRDVWVTLVISLETLSAWTNSEIGGTLEWAEVCSNSQEEESMVASGCWWRRPSPSMTEKVILK